ncbi:SH3 domain-containing protein [Sphingosinicella rhizophila]|uniref:SH3 domain-containing protein n=1 Tax=Sphingosinicella rhizophila TaxID=3050082 RepID=A0ABU3Q393_9SPHN|nr:SH3 domain-containing protein [Sphingosinicella sp. GR2756]MDT9597430.1 SH3 domain-containing protein [Sphingosinicella sp. GR2756]
MLKRPAIIALFALTATMLSSAQAQTERKTPYWASISSGKAMMRTGPATTYPATWLYVRADLPIKVIETYPSWRKIQDPEGVTGWMLVNLLSDTRTALVTGEGPHPMYESPDTGSKIRYQVQAGVVGRISECEGNWCQFDVGGRRGFINRDHIWGTDPGESID